MRLEQLVHSRIGLLGYGREGRAALAALLDYRAAVDVTVLVESGEVPDLVPAQTGSFGDNLLEFDVLIRSPGIPVHHPALRAFRQQGGQIINPASIWFSERPEVPVIGVTGSKGKSTTSALLAHLLQSSGQSVLLAGNIGVPLLGHLDTRASLVVAELSSYQLCDLEGRLHMGLITRLFDEHLDWHGSRSHYFMSKLRMAELLEGRPLLINSADPVLRSATLAVPGRIEGNRAPGFHRVEDRIYIDQAPLVASRDLALVGRHNLDNAALALEAAHLMGAELADMVRALADFRPLPHRLEFVCRAHGRRWVNDSIATSPYATRAALEALADGRVTLIAGGLSRPTSWQTVIDWIQEKPLAGLVLLPDNGGEIANRLLEAGVVEPDQIRQVRTMEEAVTAAIEQSAPGSTVLLSPGAPSFPHFRDFEQRGERFRAAVAAYRERSTA